MIDVRPFESPGHADHGWLNARHHFSFAGYHDPARMGWGALRVWNDDEIAPGTGFDRHGHRDMEIVTYVRRGAITHRDHLGNEGRTEAGNVQVMSAGKGILHEEHNLETEPTEIFQIWITPSEPGGRPYWNAAAFPRGGRAGRLVTLASGRAGAPEGALPIRQDAAILGATLPPGESVTLELGPKRRAYLVALGAPVEVDGVTVTPRSGAAIRDEIRVVVSAGTGNGGTAEIIVADVPAAG